MKTTTKGFRSILFVLLVSAVLLGEATVFGPYGPTSAFAQTDTTGPTISSVAITSDTGDDEVYLDDDGVYGIGDKIEVTVTFSENIVVTGSPRLELDIGGSAKTASYDRTSGSTVVFSYTVAVGNNDTDGIAIGSNKLTLNGGVSRSAEGQAANLSHSAMPAQSGHKVDGIKPTITRISFSQSSYNQDDLYTIGEPVITNVEFSERVYVGSPTPHLSLNFGGTAKSADLWSAGGTRLKFWYTVAEGDLALDGIAVKANSVAPSGSSIRDGAGNDAVLTHSAIAENSDHVVEGIRPTIKSVAITSNPGSDNTYGVGDTIEVTVTFSESVHVLRYSTSDGIIRMPRLELNIGGVAKSARTHERSAITGTAVVFSYTVQDGDNDSDGVSIGANKLTTPHSAGIRDNYIEDYSGCCPGGNDADITHSAVADDTGHKVVTDVVASALTVSGITSRDYAENGTASVATYAVADAGKSTITWSLSGDDSGDFSISGAGVLSFSASPDYESPADADTDNVYQVTIQASDGTNTATLDVTITVTDANEEPTLELV